MRKKIPAPLARSQVDEKTDDFKVCHHQPGTHPALPPPAHGRGRSFVPERRRASVLVALTERAARYGHGGRGGGHSFKSLFFPFFFFSSDGQSKSRTRASEKRARGRVRRSLLSFTPQDQSRCSSAERKRDGKRKQERELARKRLGARVRKRERACWKERRGFDAKE